MPGSLLHTSLHKSLKKKWMLGYGLPAAFILEPCHDGPRQGGNGHLKSVMLFGEASEVQDLLQVVDVPVMRGFAGTVST